jgi:hypothetical protein
MEPRRPVGTGVVRLRRCALPSGAMAEGWDEDGLRAVRGALHARDLTRVVAR